MRIPLAGAVAMLALAPAAHAEKLTFGSDLSQRATVVDSHPRDWSAFRPGEAAPAQGEVAQVSVRGTVRKPDDDAAYAGRYPDFVFHIVVLRPAGDGRYTSIVSTGPLPFPFGGDDQQVTTFDLQKDPARVCVQPGDVVALATSGGFGSTSPQFGGFPDDFYGNGYPVQMFARSPSASYEVYKVPAGQETADLGRTFKTQTQTGEELLMRTTIGTGADARYTCRTKAQQDANLPNPGASPAPAPAPVPQVGPAKIAASPRSPRVRRSRVGIRIACPGPKACAGSLTLSNRSRVYGRAPFLIAPGGTTSVAVALNDAARRQMRKGRGKVTVKAVLDNRDGSRSSRRFVVRSAGSR